jgi:hypothetical protein
VADAQTCELLKKLHPLEEGPDMIYTRRNNRSEHTQLILSPIFVDCKITMACDMWSYLSDCWR